MTCAGREKEEEEEQEQAQEQEQEEQEEKKYVTNYFSNVKHLKTQSTERDVPPSRYVPIVLK